MEIIKLNTFIHKTKIQKRSNGTNIFSQMKSLHNNKNGKIEGFTLDFEGIKQCASFVFKEIIVKMQTNFVGNYKLELINANKLITNSFKMAVNEQTLS